jgi:hypothetical protein
MFEFPMVGRNAPGEKRSWYTVARLRRLSGLATKLRRAGWDVWLTMTGLAFTPPDMTDDIVDEIGHDGAEEVAAEMLADLGVEEDFYIGPGRTIDELQGGFESWMWDV